MCAYSEGGIDLTPRILDEAAANTALYAPAAIDEEDGKRYCLCNGGSYGEMVACDNPNVSRASLLMNRIFNHIYSTVQYILSLLVLYECTVLECLLPTSVVAVRTRVVSLRLRRPESEAEGQLVLPELQSRLEAQRCTVARTGGSWFWCRCRICFFWCRGRLRRQRRTTFESAQSATGNGDGARSFCLVDRLECLIFDHRPEQLVLARRRLSAQMNRSLASSCDPI